MTIRSHQPTEAVPLDRSNPLTQGLAEVLLPIRGRVWDYKSGASLPVEHASVLVQGNSIGRALRTNAGSNSVYGWKAVSGLPTDFAISMLWVGRQIGSTTEGRAISLGNSGSNSPLLTFGSSSGANALTFLRATNGSVFQFATNGILTAQVRAYVVVASSSAFALYCDGVRVGSGGVSGTNATTFDRLAIGAIRRAASSNPFNGETNLAAVWSRTLSDIDATSISANPWQMFAPRRRLWAVSAGAPVEKRYLLDSSGNRLTDEEGNYLYVTGSLTFPVAIDETLTAADTVSAALRVPAAIAESVAASDSHTAQKTAAASVAESVAASDAATGRISTSAVIAESASLSDTASARIQTSGAIAESVSASDALLARLSVVTAVSETVSPSDTVTATGGSGAEVAESVAAGDAVSARLVLSASVVGPVTAADDVSASVRVAASIAESVEPSDEVSAHLRVPVLISEIVVPADLVTAPSDSDSSVSESVATSDRFEVVALRMGRAGRIGGVRRPVLGDARPMQLGGHRPPQRI